MTKRTTICDYAGNELRKNDLINYPSRTGNRVRAADAIILRTYVVRGPLGRLVPMLKVAPTGCESSFVKRLSMREEHIGAEHVRLITPGEEL